MEAMGRFLLLALSFAVLRATLAQSDAASSVSNPPVLSSEPTLHPTADVSPVQSTPTLNTQTALTQHAAPSSLDGRPAEQSAAESLSHESSVYESSAHVESSAVPPESTGSGSSGVVNRTVSTSISTSTPASPATQAESSATAFSTSSSGSGADGVSADSSQQTRDAAALESDSTADPLLSTSSVIVPSSTTQATVDVTSVSHVLLEGPVEIGQPSAHTGFLPQSATSSGSREANIVPAASTVPSGESTHDSSASSISSSGGSSSLVIMPSSTTLTSAASDQAGTSPRNDVQPSSNASRLVLQTVSPPTESYTLSSSQTEPGLPSASIQPSSQVRSIGLVVSSHEPTTVKVPLVHSDTLETKYNGVTSEMHTSASAVEPSETVLQTQSVVVLVDNSLTFSPVFSEDVFMTSSMSTEPLPMPTGLSVATPALQLTSPVSSGIVAMSSTSQTLSPDTTVTMSSPITSSTLVIIHPTSATSVVSTISSSVLPTNVSTTTVISTSTATPRTNTTTQSTHKANTTTATTVSPKKDVRYMFVLSGDCHLVLNNSEYFGRFLAAFHDLLTKTLRIPDDTYRLGEVTCGSVRIYVTFLNVIMPEFDVMIQTTIHNRGRGLTVPVWIDSGQFMTFDVTHAEQVELKPELDTYSLVTKVMDDVDIIVIIVACCVCGVLIAIGVAICVKECYRRKHAQSFDLLEIPHVNLKLEDFTLTRIPRPKTIYNDGSSVTMKSYTEQAAGKGGHHQNGINAEDMHVRVKSHSEGIVIGITSSHPYHHNSAAAVAHEDPYANAGTLRKNKSRTPSGDDYPEGEYQANERLLGGGGMGHNDVNGTINPVFLDDGEREEGGMAEEGVNERGVI